MAAKQGTPPALAEISDRANDRRAAGIALQTVLPADRLTTTGHGYCGRRHFSGEQSKFRRGIGRIGEAAEDCISAWEWKIMEVSNGSHRQHFRTQKFELFQGCRDEFLSAAAWCGRKGVRGGILFFRAYRCLIVMLTLVAADRFSMVAAAGAGSDLFRCTATLEMIARALRPAGFTAEMRGNGVILEQQYRHHLQNSCICGKCPFHIKPF